jgi:hypothetical protein
MQSQNARQSEANEEMSLSKRKKDESQSTSTTVWKGSLHGHFSGVLTLETSGNGTQEGLEKCRIAIENIIRKIDSTIRCTTLGYELVAQVWSNREEVVHFRGFEDDFPEEEWHWKLNKSRDNSLQRKEPPCTESTSTENKEDSPVKDTI